MLSPCRRADITCAILDGAAMFDFRFFFCGCFNSILLLLSKKTPQSNDPPEIKIKGLTFASAHAMSVLRETHWKDQPAGGGSNDSELTMSIYINLVTFDLRQKNIELALQVLSSTLSAEHALGTRTST